jgi:ubiquinone/menaquinone biosynthesis C-methylase UbiE
VNSRSADSLDLAALETARVLRGAVVECAIDAGLLNALQSYLSVDEIIRRMRIKDAKAGPLTAILGILRHEGLVEVKTIAEGKLAFRAVGQRDSGSAEPVPAGLRARLVRPWLPESYGQAIRNSQCSFLGHDLAFLRSDFDWFNFGANNLADWQSNLTNSLYDFGRTFAVRALAAPGRRYLDLASGTGLGAQALAEWSDWDCQITCIDKSADFVAVSSRLLYPPATRVRHVVRDLNEGLPELPPSSFDGAMMIGALHYIENKAALLAGIYRVLAPGALLVIGHCFVRSNRPDESANDYTFALVGEKAYIETLSGLRNTAEDCGYHLLNDLHRGSQYSLVLEKPADASHRRDRGH